MNTNNHLYNLSRAGDVAGFAALLSDSQYRWDARRDMSQWLLAAAKQGHLEMLAHLIGMLDGDVNLPTALDSQSAPEGVICIAASEGRTELVAWLLARNAAINNTVQGKLRCFALVSASVEGQIDVVKLLVEHGAAINSHWADMTPLDHAVAYDQQEVAEYLISKGAKQFSEL